MSNRNLFNEKYILAFGGVMFAIAFISSFFVPNYSYTCWFQCLPVPGIIAVVLCFGALGWLIIATIIKHKV